jgi:hypothetical protein
VLGWLQTGFGLVTGFIGHLQLVNTGNINSSWVCTVYSSLWHALSILNLLCLHQSSGNGFQRQTISFLWVSKLTSCLSYSNSQLTNSQQLYSHPRLNLYTPFEKEVSSQTAEQDVCQVNAKVILLPTVSLSVCLGVRNPPRTSDHFFLFLKFTSDNPQLICWRGHPIWREIGSAVHSWAPVP